MNYQTFHLGLIPSLVDSASEIEREATRLQLLRFSTHDNHLTLVLTLHRDVSNLSLAFLHVSVSCLGLILKR